MQRLRPGTPAPKLEPNAIHIYEMDLDRGPRDLEPHLVQLSPRERTQAIRFATPNLTRKYVLSHSGMRWVLSRYLKTVPEQVRLAYGEHGKPALDPSHASSLKFNLSHSGEKCLVAVTSHAAIGVDIEHRRRLEDWHAIASRFFSPRETAGLAALPPETVGRAFFTTWARKEAYIKGLGLGLALDLSSFAVETDPKRPARLTWALNESEGPGNWHMHEISVDAEYCAAVAVRGQDYRIEHWVLDDWKSVLESARIGNDAAVGAEIMR